MVNSKKISIKLRDDDVKLVDYGVSVKEISKNIGNSFSKNVALAAVNKKLVTLDYIVLEDSEIEFYNFESEEAESAIRQTLGVLVGYVLYQKNIDIVYTGVKENNFYCDFNPKENLKASELDEIKKSVNKIIKSNVNIEYVSIKKDEFLESYKDLSNKYILRYIEVNKMESISIAKINNFITLVDFPVIKNITKINNFSIDSLSGTNFLGDIQNDSLQRIGGFAFYSKEDFTKHQNFLINYEKTNHRSIGKKLNLFSFSEYAPGMPFYSHNGQTVRLELQNFLRKLQFMEDYEEVYTPFIMDSQLWKNSGHWDHYKENMYFTNVDSDEYALKPMNCPGHMIIFNNKLHSYRDLPIRMAEFGQVHRHELSGSLNGLFRVRTFNQDDAHIYVTKNQIAEEINHVLSLVDKVYSAFGFEYTIELSTRPDDFMGSIELWDFAEKTLEQILISSNKDYKINEKDGAFYGPKIDIHIKDALNRSHQCGTIQLDFQMPEKFDLNYIDENNNKVRPVVIHRAIYGSIDRFIGILLEHYAGSLPVWLSPLQVNIIPVNNALHYKYALSLKKKLKFNNIRVSIDSSEEKMGYKIRESIINKCPISIVIGDKEINSNILSVRKMGDNHNVEMTIDEVINYIKCSYPLENFNI